MMNTVQPGFGLVCHSGQSGGRGLSPRLWTNARGQAMSPDGLSNAYEFGDDFLNFGSITAGTGAKHQGYGYYVDTGGTLKQLATEVGGVIQMATGGNDNDENWLTSGGNTGVLGKISDTAAADKLLIFEARVRFPQITDTYNAFIGLAEEGLAGADTVTDGGALADKDFIGFEVLEADGNALNFIYRKKTQVKQTIISGIQALVADTWYKIGFIYDPSQPTASRIRVFVDNVENATKVTGTNIAAATFPDDEELAFLAGIKEGAAAAKYLDLDWWNLWQAG